MAQSVNALHLSNHLKMKYKSDIYLANTWADLHQSLVAKLNVLFLTVADSDVNERRVFHKVI